MPNYSCHCCCCCCRRRRRYLHRRLASSEGIVSLGVTQCVCVCVRQATTAQRISLGAEGNVLYLVLFTYYYFFTTGSKDPGG